MAPGTECSLPRITLRSFLAPQCPLWLQTVTGVVRKALSTLRTGASPATPSVRGFYLSDTRGHRVTLPASPSGFPFPVGGASPVPGGTWELVSLLPWAGWWLPNNVSHLGARGDGWGGLPWNHTEGALPTLLLGAV